MSRPILMIEDDHRLASMVRDYLREHQLTVTLAETARDGMQRISREAYDLVILDLMLPDADGLDVCRAIRAKSNLPVLMLTAKGDPLDRIVGLELGADDYLAKPFEPRELLARIKAVLRRGPDASAPRILRFGRLEIDPGAREVRIDSVRRDLTSHQFDLLLALAERAGRVLSRDQIMDLVRGTAHNEFDRSIDVHIGRIRAAIEDDPKHPRRIITVRGTGYVFATSQDES